MALEAPRPGPALFFQQVRVAVSFLLTALFALLLAVVVVILAGPLIAGVIVLGGSVGAAHAAWT